MFFCRFPTGKDEFVELVVYSPDTAVDLVYESGGTPGIPSETNAEVNVQYSHHLVLLKTDDSVTFKVLSNGVEKSTGANNDRTIIIMSGLGESVLTRYGDGPGHLESLTGEERLLFFFSDDLQ